jgi:sigma-B regulation protein RsbU (phosphoserine phosphatase)
VYYVGDKSPVTRAFPNINLAEYLGEALDFLFWRDFFQDNVQYWERYYQDRTLQQRVNSQVGSPITFDPPYEDAAGQGKIITLFYPLWNRQADRFAGVVAADVSLAKIVENVLSVHVAQTGYAVLLNGKGEIVAMSEKAEGQLRVKVEEIQRNGLKYYYRSLATSADSGIQELQTDPRGGKRLPERAHGRQPNHIPVFAAWTMTTPSTGRTAGRS